ncbi:MAG: hypothetical protein GWO41_10420, partial [candidate division Zixibacteria bacterium]|nr:hypothetical protein [candidate division Zixibacteria bacterium]NIR67660.1 hypothetical protein [candidate division Zixibacteria bacterium]NIS17083.1 hypothetical protein [candidate division Zixibacteria bacterium]NIS48918.1 hypothetical protein [candidate division Zixibacteria bacterium]NIT53133.1 hypothetical protein [candidate division Zixibacteria bacterium]
MSKKSTTLTIFITMLLSILLIGSANAQNEKDWTIVASYVIPEYSSGLAWDGTHLYFGIYGSDGGRIFQVNPADGSYTQLFTGPHEDAYGLTFDGTHLWTTDHAGGISDPA